MMSEGFSVFEELAEAFGQLAEAFGELGPMGTTKLNVSTTRLPALTAGDESVGYRTSVRGTFVGEAVRITLDRTYVRTGRALAVLTGVAQLTPMPESERARLVTVLAGRMAAP